MENFNSQSHQNIAANLSAFSVSRLTRTSTVSTGRSEDKELPKVSTRLSLISFCLSCSVILGYGSCASIFAPFFPTEAASRGVSTTVIGLVFSTFTLSMLIGSLIWSRLTKHLGLHFMIASGTVLAGGSTILFGLLKNAPPGGSYVAFCFVLRMVEGFGGSMYDVAVMVLATTLYPNNISLCYSALETSKGVGYIIGPSIGGALYNVGGFSLPFYVMGSFLLSVGFLSQIILRFTVPIEVFEEIREKKKAKKGEQVLPWSYLYQHSVQIWILTVSLSVSIMILGFPTPTLALYFQSLGVTNAAFVGAVFLTGALSYAVFSVIFGKIADSFKEYRYRIMTVGAAILVIACFFMGPSPIISSVIPPSVEITWSAIVVMTLGMAMLVSQVPSQIMAVAKDVGFPDCMETDAMVAALFNGMFYFGNFTSAPVAGALFDSVGFQWGTFVITLLALLIFFILFGVSVNAWLKNRRLQDYSSFEREASIYSSRDEDDPSKTTEKIAHSYGSVLTS